MKQKQQIAAPLVTAEQIMSKPVITVNTGDTMRHAASVLLENKISGVAVVDQLGKTIGVLTKTDIARYEREAFSSRMNDSLKQSMRAAGTLELIAESKEFRETEEDYVNHWMTPKVCSISAKASIASVVLEMSKRKIHRILVHEDTNELVGIITTFDLLKFLGRVFMVLPEKTKKAGKSKNGN